MLASPNRLRADKDISRLMKVGRGVNGKSIGLKFAPNKLGVSRFGFSVGTKVSKRSTVRNLLKRRMREIVRARLNALTPGYDVLVIARPGLQNASFRELEVELAGLLARSGLMAGGSVAARSK